MIDARAFEEVLAEMDGISLEQYRRDAHEAALLRERGELFRDLRPVEWPLLKFNWDVRPEARRFALDGTKQPEFDEIYPEGWVLGQVQLAAMDHVLCHFNKRNDLVELWGCGFASKLCSVIAYLEAGRPITPPLVAPVEGELFIVGGNHRYTAAKFSGQTQLPIYLRSEDRAAVSELVHVTWSEE